MSVSSGNSHDLESPGILKPVPSQFIPIELKSGSSCVKHPIAVITVVILT